MACLSVQAVAFLLAMAAIVLAITTWAAPRKPMALFFGHLRENGAQRWHAGAEGSSAQIREGSLSCIRYRVTAKSMRKITMTIQILMRDIRGIFCPAQGHVGVEKKPRPSGRRAGLSHTCLTLHYSRKDSRLPHRNQCGVLGLVPERKVPPERLGKANFQNSTTGSN